MINTVGGTPPPIQKERKGKRGDSYRQLYYSRETPRIGAVLLLRVFRFFRRKEMGFIISRELLSRKVMRVRRTYSVIKDSS
jgi:hypothetical protein